MLWNFGPTYLEKDVYDEDVEHILKCLIKSRYFNIYVYTRKNPLRGFCLAPPGGRGITG